MNMNIQYRIQTICRLLTGISVYSILGLSLANAETTNCTAITSLPYTVTTQGVYCFTDNLSTSISSGYAIAIYANNVTIDMNGYKLGGLAAGAGTLADGIYASKRKNITIRNGTIRGFFRGISLTGEFPFTTSQGHVIQDILADQNTYIGFALQGRGMTIRNNRVVSTGGSTMVSGAHGIQVGGPGNNIIDNQVSTTTATGNGGAFGIYPGSADYAMVKDNRVSDTSSPSGTSRGIYVAFSNDVIVRDNMISMAGHGVYYFNSTGLYGGNYTSGVTSPFTGGTAAGASNYSNP